MNLGPRPGSDDAQPYYGRARIVGGLALIGLAGILFIVDAFSEAYDVDTIQLGLLLGTAMLLLGIEAGRRLLGGG